MSLPDDDDDLVPVEGRPVRQMQDMLLYYGASLVRMGARGELNQFHPPTGAEHQALLERVHPGLLASAANDPSFAGLLGWSVEWARSGFPRVDLGHKLAASLMATAMPRDVIADLAVPWPAFAVLIPSGIVRALDPSGALKDFTHAHAMFSDGRVRMLATDAGIGCWSSAARDVTELGEVSDGTEELHSMPLDERDHRALQMVDRLVVGVCAILSSPDDAREIAKRFGKIDHRKRSSPFPEAWTYRIKRDVTVDARAVVRDYVAGGGKSPGVQSWVRGHWRRQHYGPRLSLVKWIQVEPYWRGAEDAPIAVRNHRVKHG